jgi:calpactin-1 light chain
MCQYTHEQGIPWIFENQKDPLAVDKIMKNLEKCPDGKVALQSSYLLMANLTTMPARIIL